MTTEQDQIIALTQRVERLELIVTQLVERAGGYPSGPPASAPYPPPPVPPSYPAAPYTPQASQSPIPGVPDSVIQAILARDKILAIKNYREFTGLGLREAKEAVDAFTIQLRMR